MKKADLVKEVSERLDIRLNIAATVVDTIFDSMAESMAKGERIELRGFGTFVVRHYRSYKGRNPKTGVAVDIAPKRLPYFKVGKELKELVDRKPSE